MIKIRGLVLCIQLPVREIGFSQSSTWNNNHASFASLLNNSTCAVTGLESSPWLRLDLGEEKVVTSVKLDGELISATQSDKLF